VTIWVTRPEPANAVTSAALKKAGFEVVGLPVLEVRYTCPGLPEQRPDWIVFVSANAVRGLETMGVPSGLRSTAHVASVGSRTALEAANRGWNVELVPKSENADGLLEVLHRTDLVGRTVWIPSGNRDGSARQLLPEALRARGANVVTFGVYETLDRELAPSELAQLEGADPGCIVFHSPSAVPAVFSPAAPLALRGWQRADLVAIGPATVARCREVRADRVWECAEPSDAALLALITRVMHRITQEKSA